MTKWFQFFNQSVWNALWIVVPLFCVIYAVTFRLFRKGTWYYFDPKHNTDQRLKQEGNFEPHAGRYQDMAKLVIALSVAAIGFLVNAVISTKDSSPIYTSRLQAVAPIVVGFFGCAVTFLLAFMFSQTSYYEEYCHSADHSSYTRGKYALCTSQGWTGLLAFLLGFAWLAQNLFHN